MAASVSATRTIVLIGLPGAGKSTIGRGLAKRLDRGFLDTDHMIERRLGCPIHEFFDREGEERFRDIESAVLEDALRCQPPGVLATGGGIVKRASNRALIAEHGTVVYLHATPRDLAARLRHDVRRPLLQGGNRLEKFERLFEERDALYSELADFAVDSIGRPLNALLSDITKLLAHAASTPDKPLERTPNPADDSAAKP